MVFGARFVALSSLLLVGIVCKLLLVILLVDGREQTKRITNVWRNNQFNFVLAIFNILVLINRL